MGPDGVLGFPSLVPRPPKPAARRRAPIQRRSRETVAAVLEGAARVFDREGIGATTNRIAEEAGVSIGTLYEYFPDKRALLLALGTHHMASARALVDELCTRWSTSPPGSATDAVDDLVGLLLEGHQRHRSMHALLTSVAHEAPALLADAMAMQAQLVGALADALSRADPTLDDVELRAEMIMTISAELTHGPLLHASGDDLERWTTHLRALVHGYLAWRARG